MPLDPKVKKIYDTLKSGGANIGTEDEFSKNFFAQGNKGYENRKKVFNALSQGGEDVGKSYEEFRDRLRLGAVSKQSKQQASAMIGGKATQPGYGDGSILKRQPKNAVEMLEQNKPQQFEASYDVPVGDGKTVKRKVNDDIKMIANRQLEPMKQQFVDKNGNVVKEQEIYPLENPELAYERALNQSVAASDLERQSRERLAEIEREENALKKKQSLGDSFFMQALANGITNTNSSTAAPGVMNQRAQAYNEYLKNRNPELEALAARKDLAKERIKLIEDAKKDMGIFADGEGLSGVVRNATLGPIRAFQKTKEKVLDPKTWDFGATDANTQMAILDAVTKLGSGEQLSKNEQKLLDDWALTAAVNSHYGDQLSGWTKAAMVTGDAFPYMLEMGFSPFSRLGGAAQRELMRFAEKKYGKKVVEGFMKRQVANKITKGAGLLGRVGGDALGANLMATTSGSARVAGDTARRMSGDVKSDVKDGNVVFAGTENGETAGDAIFKSIKSQAIEDWSEMAGQYFGFVNNAVGKLIGKSVVGKAGRKALGTTGNIDNVSLGKAQRFIYDLTARKGVGAFSEGLDQFLKKTKWDGVFGEYAEEVLGNMANAITVGDQTLDTKEGTGVFNLEQNIDTFCGVALLGGFMSAVNTGGYAWHKFKNNPDRVSNENSKIIDNWQAVKTSIDNAADDPREINDLLTDLIRTPDQYDDKQKKAILKYTASVMEERGQEMAAYKPRVESMTTEQSTTESADGNSTVPTFVVSTFDKNGNEIEKQTFYSEEDADAYKTQTKMEQQKQDYDEYLNMAGKLNQQETETVIDTFLKEHGYDEADDSEKSIMLQDINDSKTPLGKEFRDYKNEKSVEKAQSSMDAIRQFEEDNGWEEGTVRYLSEGDPMKMSEEELQMADQAREFLKTLSYPSSVVHPEISAREGSETADQVVENVVSTTEPINPENNPGKDIVDSYVSAEKERNALFDNDENLKEEVEMMEAGGLSPQEIISSLDTFSDAQKQVLINFYNAQAKYDSYMLQAENKINEVAEQGRQKRTFAGTINGQEDKANIVGITDGTNTYTLISGDISTSPEGNVTGSESGMLLALDENGEIVQLGESSNYTVLPTEMTLDEWEAQEVTRLQQEVSMVSDPNMSLAQTEQTQDKPQEEQADVEAGGENTGADEASATPTATERIPVDDEGNPVYEKAAPEDVYDSLSEQVGDMTPTIVKNQLDAAKKRLEKLVKDKEAGKLKGKNIQEQIAEVKELQEKINAEQELVSFWTKVMTVPNNRRADEANKPAPEPTETTETVTNETPVEEPATENVPDWTVDKASDARVRGYRMENGYRVDRQEPISNKVEGNDIEVKFDKNEEPVKGKLVVVESGSLIPSHVNGQRNVNFFINEAQPKERTDIDSDASSTRIAKKINPEEITAGVTAFTGSPVVNTRGEVIQGNNRTIGLQKMWNNYPDSQDKYKQYLIDHAEEFGLNKDEIVKMSSPVLVRMVDVPDEEAIRLGQKTASNTESGGKERIDPMRVIQQMGEQYRVFTNLLFSGEIEDQTLMSIISENGVKVLKWLNDSTSHPKYISDTQFQSCFDAKGNLTEEAKTDLRKIVENMLFQDAPESLSEMFYKMPAKAQNAILSTLWRDSQSEENDKIINDIQSSIEAFAVINSASEEFRNAKDVNSARAAVKDLKKQTQMFGNTETVLEKFSNFALELAILYKGAKQNDIRGYFNTYYDGVQGKGGSLFETPEKKSKEQAIKDTYGIDINEKENGEEGNNTLESDNTNGESGEPNNEGEPGVGKRVEEGEQPAISGGGTETSGEVEAATEEQPQEEVEEQPKEEEPFELTLEALEASDLDESVKSGARAWLNGEKTQANQFAFLIAQDYVRSIHGDTERGGTDADTSQLGSEDNVSANGEAGRGNGESGPVDSADNGEGVSEVGIGGTDSTGNVAGSNGAGSDNGVSGQAPEQNGDSDTDGTLGSIGNRRTRRNGKSRGEGSGTTIPGGNAGRQTVASARAELDAALKEFEDALKESITEPLKGKLLAADPVSLYAFLGGAKAIKVLSAGTKVAYAAIKLGYYEFKDWVGMMKSKLGDPLRNIAGMSEEQIDGFIEMMWDYDLTVDGVTRKVSEWASVISDEALREQMNKTIEEKRKLQKEAEKTPTILGDITNIRESLPFLLTKQQEDVQKAERQFFDESHADVRHGHGKGYMFTNGTGTGKTYTGLGIVKRFLKQGKGRILIVTASETKINDWIKDAKNLGIEASMLPDTSSKGKGVVVTQFANIRQNRKLLEDVFDLIVYDESHKLMENQDGSATSTSRAHHMLSNRDVRQALRRELMAGEFGKAIEDAEVEIDLLNQAVSIPTTEWTNEVKDAYNKAGGNMDAVEDRIKELKELTERLEETIENEVDKLLADPEQVEKAREATKNTKVVFLSATPFNVPANMDYAEGYIFSYSNDDEVKKETDRLRDRDSFLVENFNSSHTRNPKTQVVSRISQERIPDPQKASEEEVIFSDKLQNDLETMSGRDLDSEYDYSREFPKMDFEMADKFNDAIQSLSDGRFDPLRKYFDHLLDDYTTMTGYLEIFKAQMIAPRIQQYIDLGKKVTLYHRRKASNSNMYPPFALAMQKARREDDEKINDAVEAFERTFKSLFQWEDSIDYMFPQDSILREFMTDEEKATYKKEFTDWYNQFGEQIKKLQSEVMNLNIMIDLFESSGHKEKTPELLDQIKEKNKEIDKLMKKRPKPKCAVVSVFNGSETAKDRSEAIKKFNDDDSKTKVLVVQVQAGKEGISLHDTTGKYPRVQIGIFLPQSPIEFIQTEGRIFRVGNKSNAIFEYPLLGLDIELGNFAQKINGRSETTENLALGSRGRGLKDSISRAALASRKIDPSTATGIGGKELDSRQAQNADGFDEAMKNYSEWREEPKPTDINQIEVPDPIGYVMTKLTRAEKGERALVPNARRGSVARYMPSSTRLTAMEERNKDYARLSALIGGSGRKILNEPFSEHNRVNKYDIVVINTSHGNNGEKDMFGNATSLDTKDVLKACNHTDPSGRVVALVESDKVGQIKEALKKSTTSVPVMEVKLPSFVLGKPSSIVILDNIENRDKRNAVKTQELDLSQAKTDDNLFAQLRDMIVPERNIDQEGRVERRLRTVVTPFVNTGCLAKSKNYSTNKMEPDIQCTFGRLLATFARNKMVWVRANGRAWRQFVIRYSRIVENDISYIQEIANEWININRQLELDDDSLYDVVKYWLDGKERLGGVRDCLKIMSQAIEIALGKTPMQIKNIAEGRVENEVSGTYDLKGFRDVFNSLNNNDAELEALADKVFEAVDHIEGLKFSVLPGTAFRSGGGHNVVAHYVPSRNVIELNSDIFNSVRYKDSFKAQTVVHEMIHALTTWAIETYDNENTRGQLSPEQQEAVRTIKDVFSQINNDDFRRQLRLESELEDNAEYGLTNEHEMMAELSNPIFRKVLKAKKLWRQLINGVKMLLGIEIPNAESEETDALTALDNALETLMNNYDPTLYSSYIRNNEVVRNMEIRNPNDPMQAINDAANSFRESRKGKKDLPEVIARHVYDIPRKYGLKGAAITQVINSRGELEQLKDKVDDKVYNAIKKDYEQKGSMGSYAQGADMAIIFGENIGTASEGENVWWHEQTHGFWHTLPKDKQESYGKSCLDYIRRVLPELYDNIMNNYDKDERYNEACSFFAENVVKNLGANTFLNSKFEGDENLCNFANELINYLKNGRQEKGRKASNQSGRDTNEQGTLKIQGRNNNRRGREGDSSRSSARGINDPMKSIEVSARRWLKDQATSSGANPMSQSERAVYERILDKVETVLVEAFQDAMIALKVGQNAIAHNNDIPDSQNAYMAENLMHGKNKVEMDMFNAMFRDPLIETINRIMEETGMNWGDIDRYVYTKSGLERNREFFVRDWLEKQRSKDEDVDDVEQGWKDTKENAYGKLMAGTITFPQYLEELDTFIRSLDEDYEPSEHDYSGFRAMFGEDYDEEEVINELMETENEIGADNVSELWDKVNACTKYGLERYREAGLKSDAQIDNVKKMFHWYVPMRGFKEQTNEDLYQYFTGKGKTKNYVGGLLKHAKGRGSEASYPISTIFSMTYKAISDCNQNLVNQKFYRLCQAHKNDLVVLSDAWVKLNEATGEWEEVWPDINDDMTEDEIRQATLDFEKNMNTLANVKKAQKIRGKANFPYKMLDKNKKNEHVVEVWMNGQKKLATVVGNPRMAQALNGQLRFERKDNMLSKVNAWIKNKMASLFTSYSPTFALRNMMRDWTHFSTMLMVREGEKYAKAAIKYYDQQDGLMMRLFKKYREGTLGDSEIEQDFNDFMRQGGVTGFVQMRKVDDIQNEMEKLNKQMKDGKVIKLNNKLWDYTLGAVEAFNEAIENNARFATYRASRHVAMRTKARSAYDAKEITVNFNRKGAGSKTFGFKGSDRVEHAAQAAGITAQVLGEGRIFFNATIQAISTIFKNTQNPDGSINIPYVKRLVARYALPPFMFGFALPLINEALAGMYGDGDDDPYANLPEWTRRKNLCIYVGNNNFITIPVGQELAAFLSLGDTFAGMTYAPNLKPLDRTFTEDLAGALYTFSPIDLDTKITKGGITRDPLHEVAGRTLSVLAPVIAVGQNLSWTGRPIYREDVYKNDKYTPEYQMVYSGVNPVLVEASKILHELGGGDDITRGSMEVNPAIVQYLWEQYTGGPGKVFSNFISLGHDVKDVIEGRESDFNFRKIEGLKAFVQQGDDHTEFYRSNAKYRKYREDAEKLYNDIKGYKKLSEKDPMAKIKMASKTRGVDYTRMQIIRKAEKYISKMNKEANAAEGARKKELRRAVNEEIKSIVDVLDKVEEDK